MGPFSSLAKLVTSTRHTVAITASLASLLVALAKYLIVVSLLCMGVARHLLQALDAILTGALAAALLWVLLTAVRGRQKQGEQLSKVVADLNHHLRNALQVILASGYLRDSDKAAAILESVERIDINLRTLLPWPTNPRERRTAPRRPTQQRVTVRFPKFDHLELAGITKDISSTGIFIYLDADVVEGIRVELLLALPEEAEKATMPIRGKVVRVERGRLVGSPGIAIAFCQTEILPRIVSNSLPLAFSSLPFSSK
jgi:hypothetical protein